MRRFSLAWIIHLQRKSSRQRLIHTRKALLFFKSLERIKYKSFYIDLLHCLEKDNPHLPPPEPLPPKKLPDEKKSYNMLGPCWRILILTIFFPRKHLNLYLELPSSSGISHPSSVSISARTFAVSFTQSPQCSGSLWLLCHIGAQASCLKSALSSTHKNHPVAISLWSCHLPVNRIVHLSQAIIGLQPWLTWGPTPQEGLTQHSAKVFWFPPSGERKNSF